MVWEGSSTAMGFFCVPSKPQRGKEKQGGGISPTADRRKAKDGARPLVVVTANGVRQAPVKRPSPSVPSPDMRRDPHGAGYRVQPPRPPGHGPGPVKLTGSNPYTLSPVRRFTDEDLRKAKQERIAMRKAKQAADADISSSLSATSSSVSSPQTKDSNSVLSPVPALNFSFQATMDDHDRGF